MTLNISDKIHYLVTRPAEAIVDDGRGNYNISPIGFPERDYSGTIAQNPTRVTPKFFVGYQNVISESSRLVLKYTELNNNLTDLNELKTLESSISTLTSAATTATATTTSDHGYTSGMSITISNANYAEYNGTFTITVTGATTFTYTISSPTTSPDIGTSIKASYTMAENDVVYLTAQTNSDENGYYVVKSSPWQKIFLSTKNAYIVKGQTTTNINVGAGSTPTIQHMVAAGGLTFDGTYAIMETATAHGFATGSSIVIALANDANYNGTVEIETLTATSFRYVPSGTPATSPDTSVTTTATYQTVEGDIVYVAAQTDPTEDGIYIVHSATAWELYAIFYSYDGTENDNVAGDYGVLIDSDGNPLNHYRKGYSFEETANYLREKLNTSIEFGKFKGTAKNLHEQGALIKWLLSGRKVNIGGEGVANEVFVDGFGLGNPDLARKDRTYGEIDPYDSSAINAKQTQIQNANRVALWGLTNHHSNALSGFFNKSPFVKDYPFIYNSEYPAGITGNILEGSHLQQSVDAEHWRMVVTGTTASTDVNVRPFTMDMLWYHRDNAYHNNITLDMSNPDVYGRHSMAIIQNLDTPDEIVLFEQQFDNTDITVNTPPTDDIITVPDGSLWTSGDYVQFEFPAGVTAPTGVTAGNTYVVNTVATNDLTLFEYDGVTPINITNAGSGTFKIQRHVFGMYDNNIIADGLDNIESVTLNSGRSLLKKVTDGTVDKYYWKPRKKYSLGPIAAKGAWDITTLSYDAMGSTGAYGVNVYLESTETDYVTFTHPTKTSNDIITDLNDNNDMIPELFDSATVDVDSLTELFTNNSLVDYTDPVNQSEKIRSKKTFIHLPTPLDLADGTQFELDISLPIVPDTDSFGYSTVGSLSGYRNYITQPRVYVLSGYQKFECTDIAVTSLTQTTGTATVTTTADHGYFTSTFAPSAVNTSDVTDDANSIAISNWKDAAVGDYVRFKSTATLPTGISAATDYVIRNITQGRIQLNSVGGSPINITAAGSGTHSIVIQKSVRVIIKGATQDGYNGEYDAQITDFNKFTYMVDAGLASPATGTVRIDRVIYVSGGDAVEGLTERSNSAVFGAMPEVEFAEDGNVYHQTFTLDNIVGNNKVGDDEDKRVLLATVYPTTSNTFCWRLDNDPQIRMLQWSLLNSSACGGEYGTGAFANVAYRRNKDIFDEFGALFKDGADGKFTVYDNPLSYATVHSPEINYNQQQVNAYVRVKLPNTLVPSSVDDLLSEEDTTTVGSFVYQASKAYNSLITDFSAGRVRFESRKDSANFETDALSYEYGFNGNHGSLNIPTSFYDTTAGQEFILYNTTDLPNPDSLNGNRWITRGLFTPEYVIDAETFTNIPVDDSFAGTTTLKTYLKTEYAVPNKVRETNAGNRSIVADLNPAIDPTFEFSVNNEHPFIKYLLENNIADTDVNDVRRTFWDSYYPIPDPIYRRFNIPYLINGSDDTIENTVKFFAAPWMPFARLFSTECSVPADHYITLIEDYATITGGGYTEIDNTIDNALLSNPIASRFKTGGYTDAFVSINVSDANSDLEEFLRSYIAGYSNRMPFRFYNAYRIVVHGDTSMSGHSTNTALDYIYAEYDVDRIFNYSVRDYFTEYGDTPPSTFIGQYIDDNFIFDNQDLDSGNVVAEDYNFTWRTFDDGDGVSSTIKDLINVSGMNYIASRSFYQSKMKYNYIRYKMKFVFSTKAGRWLTLDYRQAPTSYLTPTFGSVALKQKESSVVYAGKKGLNILDYVAINQPDTSNAVTATIGTNYVTLKNSPNPFNVGDVIAVYNDVNTFTAEVSSISGLIVYLDNTIPTEFDINQDVHVAPTTNTIDATTYPYDSVSGTSITDYLWSYDACFQASDIYKDVYNTPYYLMEPIKLNRFCYPFLSTTFPYSSDGELDSLLDSTIDASGAESLRFNRLIEPNLADPDGINFIVPNNVHGGASGADDSLFLYQPHMWKVYWHIRPAMCAMEGTDIPSPTERTGGEMADPVLNSMFCLPDMRNLEYYIPWHEDMAQDWLGSAFMIIDAKINDPLGNPTRDNYFEFDSTPTPEYVIDGDTELRS